MSSSNPVLLAFLVSMFVIMISPLLYLAGIRIIQWCAELRGKFYKKKLIKFLSSIQGDPSFSTFEKVYDMVKKAKIKSCNCAECPRNWNRFYWGKYKVVDCRYGDFNKKIAKCESYRLYNLYRALKCTVGLDCFKEKLKVNTYDLCYEEKIRVIKQIINHYRKV